MTRPRLPIDIAELVKPGKDIVVELEDDVEYIVDAEAVAAIKAEKSAVTLIRVIDRKPIAVSTRRIKWGLHKEGVIDYLDHKPA